MGTKVTTACVTTTCHKVTTTCVTTACHKVTTTCVTTTCHKVTTACDCNHEINNRISKAMLRPVWRAANLSVRTKIKIFRSNVMSVRLNGAECWKITVAIQRRIEVFLTKFLRRILKIYRPNTISNEEQINRTGMNTLTEIIQTRRWRWLGHVCRMPSNSITRTALRLTAQSERKRG